MGTPDFAVASLRRLVEDGHEICGVFTQPDRPKNRGHKLMFSPVKQYAVEQGLTVYQPLKMKDGTALATVRELKPELIVVAAYGRILPEDILNTPKYGSINVHSSLLPKYRGAAPINWAILDGEKETGVSIMYMAPELDAGDVIRAAKTAARTPQDHTQSTYAPMLTREMSAVDWTLPAQQIHDQVRGLIPWPCAVCELGGQTLKLFSTRVGGETAKAPGCVIGAGKQGIEVACGDGRVLRILELQAQGGRRMAAADYLRGHEIPVCL